MNKDIDIEKLLNINYRAFTLLGVATSIVMEYQNLEAFHDNGEKCDWFIKAVEKLVYPNE